MDTIKIWRSEEKDDDKVIAYLNQTIYKGNPKIREIDNCIAELKMLKVPALHFFGIPLRYIVAINMEESKNYIEVLFKGDYEYLRIKDDRIKEEVFEYFKQNLPGVSFHVIKYSKIKAGKKPLIAMAIVSLIFIWTLYIAVGVEAGNEYDVTGQRYNSIAGIVVSLASIGVRNVVLLFGSLFVIAAISFIRKAMHPPVISQLVIK